MTTNLKTKRNLADFATYIILAAASVFALLPILWGLSTSLKPESLVISASPSWIPSTITLENYYQVLFVSSVPRYLLNSIFVSLIAVTLTLVVAIHAGYAAARFKFKGKNGLLFYILMTSMIPGISVLVPLYVIAIYLNLHNTYTIMILIYAAWQTPTAVWIIKGFFETIPHELEDAARVDGCSSLRILYQIMVPIAQPGLAAAAVICFVYIWNDFLIAFTFTTDQNLRLINVGLYQFLSQYGTVWGQLTAAVMIGLLPVLVMFVALETRFIEGLAAGSTKG
ncbi:MAG: carbohydrate ABC transporter permease [Anaerolineae bacterium]|nr:carbohydrate ABC transporter permease [Anaerolineae bacterium]